MFKIILEENLLKKVILHNEKYLSLLPEVFLQEKSNYGQVIIYSVFILIVLIIVSLFLIEIDEVVKVQGVVKPEENISIVKNIVSGKILKINYEAGKIVNAGDLLYKIDDSSLISQLETELNFLNQYETELFVYKNILHLLNGKTLEDEDDNLNEEILLKYNSYLSSVNKIKKEIEINENYYNDEILKPINLSSRISIRDKKAKLEYLKLGLAEYQINYKNEINEKIKSYQKLCLESNFKIDSLLLEIEKTNVCSPVDGIIQEIQTFNEGDFIFSSQKVNERKAAKNQSGNRNFINRQMRAEMRIAQKHNDTDAYTEAEKNQTCGTKPAADTIKRRQIRQFRKKAMGEAVPQRGILRKEKPPGHCRRRKTRIADCRESGVKLHPRRSRHGFR